MVLYLKNISSKNLQAIREKLIFNAATKGSFWSISCLVLTNTEQYSDIENGHVLLYEDVTSTKDSWDLAQMNMFQVKFKINPNPKTASATLNVFICTCFQVIASKIAPRQLPQPSPLDESILFKSIQLRCIIQNYLHGTNYNETEDRKIIDQSLTLIGELYAKSKTDKEFLLYNE